MQFLSLLMLIFGSFESARSALINTWQSNHCIGSWDVYPGSRMMAPNEKKVFSGDLRVA